MRCQARDNNHWVLSIGHCILGIGDWGLGTRHRLLVTGYWLYNVVGNRHCVLGAWHRLLVTGYWL